MVMVGEILVVIYSNSINVLCTPLSINNMQLCNNSSNNNSSSSSNSSSSNIYNGSKQSDNSKCYSSSALNSCSNKLGLLSSLNHQ